MSWAWRVQENGKQGPWPRDIPTGHAWWWRLFGRQWERRHDILTGQLLDAANAGYMTRAEWSALGFDRVAEARWLAPGQVHYADEVLYVPVGAVLPEWWYGWPSSIKNPTGWRVTWSAESRL